MTKTIDQKVIKKKRACREAGGLTIGHKLIFKRKNGYKRKRAYCCFTCLLQVKALFYDDEQTYDAEIVSETKLGFKVVFTEYGNDQVI